MASSVNHLLTILGATATGKTKIASKLAYQLDGEIISADSRQVYRGMDIGTGKDLEDYIVNGVPIIYHLIDIKEPGYEYNIHEFGIDAKTAYDNITSRGKQSILCGGSGLYIESFLKGWAKKSREENSTLKPNLADLSNQELYALLKQKSNPHNTTDLLDRNRLLKATEIALLGHSEEPIPSIIFGLKLERSILRQRTTKRLQHRLENGMIDEVKSLLNKGYNPEALIFYGLEYRYLTLYLTGDLSYQQMYHELDTAIHQFAKRQETYFRRMEKNGMKIHWIDAADGEDTVFNKIIESMNKSCLWNEKL